LALYFRLSRNQFLAKQGKQKLSVIEYRDGAGRMEFHIDFSDAERHLADVTLWIPVLQPQPIILAFPVWTPGSYMVREYSRNVESLKCFEQTVRTDEGQHEIQTRREGKNRWIFASASFSWLRVEYRVYCRENTVRTNWVERDYGFLTGASVFPYVVGRENEGIEVHLDLPSNWPNHASSMKQLGRQANSAIYLARNYDELVDSPIVCGDFPIEEFEVGGKPHYFVNVGGDGLWDLQRATSDMKTIVAEHQAFWGSTPYSDYWFLNLCTEAGGGLEHDNSTVLMCSRWTMRRRETYLNWLALVSHEFFHTWNVRRLRPMPLMNYDYEQEQFIEELWIAEGITSYFDDLCLVRTGLCSRAEYLARLTANVQAVLNAHGRFVQDLVSASWDTWTKHYRPDENSPNSRISYYLKGAVLAWLLDARLQAVSGGTATLDEAMRLLWQRHLQTGYTLDDFHAIIQELGGTETRQWLESHVRGTGELQLQPALNWLGLRIQELEAPHVEKSVAKVWIGSESTGTDGRLFVRRVFRNSPSDRAGLNVDDELISFDGYRVTPDTWPSRLEVYEPEQEIELLVSRRGKMLKLKIVLGHKPRHNWQIEEDPSASAQALEAQKQWLRLPSNSRS
jgi:predicted metalloprotease with PDZ domain